MGSSEWAVGSMQLATAPFSTRRCDFSQSVTDDAWGAGGAFAVVDIFQKILYIAL